MFSTSPVIGQQFAFAHGRTGVLQQSLLSQTDIDRLLAAGGMREAGQILTELRLTKLIDQSLRDPQEILAACQAWVRREVEGMSPKKGREIFNILWMDGDLSLLAYALKRARNLTSDVSREPRPPFTALPVTQLQAAVEGTNTDVPAALVDLVQTVRSNAMNDPKRIDALVAQYGADERLALARKSGSSAIRRYVRHGIDMQNIRTALRMSDSEAAHADHLIRGGTISVESLLSAPTSLATTVRLAGFHALADVLERTPEDINAIERAMSDVLAEDVAGMWNVILSIEPIFAFAITALAQLRLVRAIILGKRNNLSPQQIKQILPPFLSASHYVL